MTKEEVEKTAFKWVFDGLNASQQGDLKKAIECFEKAIELEPKSSFGYFYLGMAFHDTKEYTKAIDNFENAITLKPDYAESWMQMGLSYLAIGKDAKAQECIEKGTEFASVREHKPVR